LDLNNFLAISNILKWNVIRRMMFNSTNKQDLGGQFKRSTGAFFSKFYMTIFACVSVLPSDRHFPNSTERSVFGPPAPSSSFFPSRARFSTSPETKEPRDLPGPTSRLRACNTEKLPVPSRPGSTDSSFPSGRRGVEAD
jgi:hypothetical protein